MKDKLKNWFTGFVISAIGTMNFFFGAYSIVAFIRVITSTGWMALLNLVYLIIFVTAFIKFPQMLTKAIKEWLSFKQSDNNDSTKEQKVYGKRNFIYR